MVACRGYVAAKSKLRCTGIQFARTDTAQFEQASCIDQDIEALQIDRTAKRIGGTQCDVAAVSLECTCARNVQRPELADGRARNPETPAIGNRDGTQRHCLAAENGATACDGRVIQCQRAHGICIQLGSLGPTDVQRGACFDGDSAAVERYIAAE